MARKSNAEAATVAKVTKPRPRNDHIVRFLHPEGPKSVPSGATLIPVIPGAALKGAVRDAARRLPSRHWKQNLEKNLIEEGVTPAKAKELVELAAS